jgi:hypothetical protein
MLAAAIVATTVITGRGKGTASIHTNPTMASAMKVSRSVPRKNPSTVYQHSTLVRMRFVVDDDWCASHPMTKNHATPWVRNRRLAYGPISIHRYRNTRSTRSSASGNRYGSRRSHRRTAGIARSNVATSVSWTNTSVNQ